MKTSKYWVTVKMTNCYVYKVDATSPEDAQKRAEILDIEEIEEQWSEDPEVELGRPIPDERETRE